MPTVRGLRELLVAGSFLLSASAAIAAPQLDDTFTVYSDLCYHAESGDLLGTRAVVMRFKEGSYVLFQVAEGEIQAPQVVKIILDPKGNDVAFGIAESEKSIANFKGKITDQLLTGSFDNNWQDRSGKKTFRLPRIVGKQRSFPDCK